jgi:exodeoxyribonuclease-1
MNQTFFFYDLETSGLRPSQDRIMQFAGQRTDLHLKAIGQPFNQLIKLSPDVLPDPTAVLLTGITPQMTLEQGISEAEFLKLFYDDIAQPGTIFVGFNNVRFDDEFIRFLNFRNFYDPYSWSWQDQRSRWDILDMVRMTRALRPSGLNWPDKDQKPSNRLEDLTKANHLDHFSAHDALSDVHATIELARVIKKSQPKIFNYLLSLKTKKAVAEFIAKNLVFVYTSSHFSSDYLHTTIVTSLNHEPINDSTIVYNLRYDPRPYLAMSKQELIKAWQFSKDPALLRLPIKTLKFNRVPAVAPLGVIDEAATARLDLNMAEINHNLELLNQHKQAFSQKLKQVVADMDQKRQVDQLSLKLEPDQSLYSGFINEADARLLPLLRSTAPAKLDEFRLKLNDSRLKNLLVLYKARNYPESLNDQEKQAWLKYRKTKLNQPVLEQYKEQLSQLYQQTTSKTKRVLLDQLASYLDYLEKLD